MNSLLTRLAVTLVDGGSADIKNVPTLTSEQVLQNGLNIAYLLAGIIAVIVIIIGGFMYTTSGGDSSGVTKAKNLILYAVVGLIVIIAAFAITNFVLGNF